MLALLYAQGGRGRRQERARAAAFYGGLATIVIALDTPIDAYADTLFSVHMLQHVLLLTVAPPLLVLGRAWPRLWLPLPVEARRAGASVIAAAAPLTRPDVSLLVMSANFGAWHIPALYDLTLRNGFVHQFEHLTFVVTGVAFWAAMLGAPPLRTRIDDARRCLYFVLAMIPGWILALVLAYTRSPIYSYTTLGHRPGGLSPLADQQIAAGVMWVPGSIAYTAAACWALYVWLEPGRAGTAARAATQN